VVYLHHPLFNQSTFFSDFTYYPEMTSQQTYDEKKLLKELAAGDENAYKTIYLQYDEVILKLVMKYLRSAELAKDVSQDIFIKVWENREKLPRVKHFKPYLLQIARNQAYDVLRAAGRSDIVRGEIARHALDHPGFFDDEMINKEYRSFIKRTIESLPPRSREVFLLCREQGKTYDEVAAALGISRNVVRKHMILSMQKFKDAAEDELGLPMSLILPLLTFLLQATDATRQ